MSISRLRKLLVGLLLVLVCGPLSAHVGSKDVFEDVQAGPYKLFVTIRMPVVIPGIARLEVRTETPIQSLAAMPVPMTGESSKHPPTPDALQRSPDDPNFYTGSLWIMANGSWKVEFLVNGPQGSASAGVPAPAAPVALLPMQRSLGWMLGILGLVLVIGAAGIAGASVREARLEPGEQPDTVRRKRAIWATAAALVVIVLGVYGGGHWWSAEAADYAKALYRPLALTPVLKGDTLDLKIAIPPGADERRFRATNDLVPDHGQMMHLYAIREPQMDAVFHLHPQMIWPEGLRGDLANLRPGQALVSGNIVKANQPQELQLDLPAMPPGEYRLYGDIVHAAGFPETLVATLTIPPGLQAVPLGENDASASPPPLSQGDTGASYKLPDGYTMVWDKPGSLQAERAYSFKFRLLDKAGKPASGMQPYLGMAGHAAFVKTDGTVFAHTHPDGSAAMPAMMLANPTSASSSAMPGMAGMPGMEGMTGSSALPVGPEVAFPYGFPTSGRYRIFIQMKHDRTVETGVFDAEVQ